ncbi:DUF4232 domain-containing protein [Streptomyces sp. NPDC006368]|uniref:DUF4232 domain-containing protein n=1 Tax=Streptomyces sp. NPDC006368 TaxID=3156760 RepID=UPI0033BF0C03
MRGYAHLTARTLAAAAATVTVLAAAAAPAAPATGASVGQAPSPCRTADLSMAWAKGGTAKPGGTGDQDTAVVRLTHTGDRTCTLKGFPDVVLLDGTDRYDLPQAQVTPSRVTLAPGRSTTFTVVFLSEKDDPKQAFDAVKVAIAAPGDKASKTLPWPWGPVTDQRSATHPGSYVLPVGAKASS